MNLLVIVLIINDASVDGECAVFHAAAERYVLYCHQSMPGQHTDDILIRNRNRKINELESSPLNHGYLLNKMITICRNVSICQ